MILRWHYRWRQIRRLFNRTEWMVRILGLPKEQGEATHGLVMIQIDGLSHQEFQHALREGEMPFVSRLLNREDYSVRKMYSGIPSNTPAMQAELFYGVPGAVPSFGFFHKGCNRVCRMLEPDTARSIEAELAEKGEPLLKDGSAYGNIYTGGAREPRWCAASMGLFTQTKSPGVFRIAVLVLLNFYGFLRAVAFGLLELGIALLDAIRGTISSGHPKHEFKFIPARVSVCVLLREWITHAARMDISRGLPIVHLNFVGYDEQSHHRGPDSAFAHWVLGGIDDSIKRIWRAAKNSDRRHYDVWIYSDHGQVRATPYVEATGKTLSQTVNALWEDLRARSESAPKAAAESTPAQKALEKAAEKPGRGSMWKGAHGSMRPLPSFGKTEPKYPLLTEFGPLALIYLGPDAVQAERDELGERLAREKGVPLVVDARRQGAGESSATIHGWSAEGPFTLPADAERILAGHPFRDAVIADLERVTRHPHAGDLIALGWRGGSAPKAHGPLTFAFEYGAHGGISPDECTAFAAMPRDRELERARNHELETLIDDPGREGAHTFMRPVDLRHAALAYMGRAETIAADPPVPSVLPKTTRLRVMTYNVHSCIGLDQRHDVRRIARVIAHYHPDVVALQELDVGHHRSGGVHQAQQIAALLRYEYHFHSVREIQDQQFGNAILSRYPMNIVKVGALPIPKKPGPEIGAHTFGLGTHVEARGALWVELEVNGRRVQILNTHLGLGADERAEQVATLLGPDWLGSRDSEVPVIVSGDLNCGPGTVPYRRLCGAFQDAQLQIPRYKPRNTWFSQWPMRRIDHVFVSDPLRVRHIHIPTFHLATVASDHLPLVADLELPPAETEPAGKEDSHVA